MDGCLERGTCFFVLEDPNGKSLSIDATAGIERLLSEKPGHFIGTGLPGSVQAVDAGVGVEDRNATGGEQMRHCRLARSEPTR